MARISKYDPETVPEQTKELAMLGFTQPELAKFFEVSERTFKDWIAKYPALKTAVKMGGAVADAKVVASLFNRACGYSHPEDDIRTITLPNGMGSEIVITPTIKRYPPDTTAALAWLHNRQRGKWQRTPDPSGGDDDIPPTKVIFQVIDGRKPDRDSSEPESPAG